MKLTTGQTAVDFSMKDVNGNDVSLAQYKGQKIHLNFYRFSGCPSCNLRFHQVEKLADLYRKNDVKLICVYESSVANMKAQIADEKFYATMIPDPAGTLYRLYDLDRSKLGMLKYFFFHGGLKKASEGHKLFRQKVALDGHQDRVEAEFLIDEEGKLANAHYGKIPGDYLPLDVIKDFIEGK